MKNLIIALIFCVLLFTACNSSNNTVIPEDNIDKTEQTEKDTVEEVSTDSIETKTIPAPINNDKEIPDDDREDIVGLIAIGNEPGWGANFEYPSLTLVLDYGELNYSNLDYTANKISETSWEIKAISDEITFNITIKSGGCNNNMSGQAFSHNVTLVMSNKDEEKTYKGCGKHVGDIQIKK